LEFKQQVPHNSPELALIRNPKKLLKGATAAMEIKVQKQSGEVVILLNGTLNGSTACEIEQVLQSLVEGGGTKLVIDFSGVGKVEYFGVVVFARVLRSQGNQFGSITLAGLRPSVEKIFERFGLSFFLGQAEDSSGGATTGELPSWQTS
jgi:anti-anti-sigma factor